MSAESVARDHYLTQKRLADAAARVAGDAWAQVDPGNVSGSWRQQSPEVTVAVVGAQRAAAQTADGYLNSVLAEQGVSTAAVGQVVPSAFSGVASDGRRLDSLLAQPVPATLAAVNSGVDPPRAMAMGQASLDMIVRTQIADAGRGADQVALVAHPSASGYVRLLVPPSCSRCAILAGRWYRYSSGFLRHPRCDCRHIPSTGPNGRDLTTNPRDYFDSLSREEQDRLFGQAGARAIRDGADMAQIVNARRGMYTAGGRSLTRTSTTRRGVARPGRLTPEEIYRTARSRDEALNLLRQNGYLSGVPRRILATTLPRPRLARPTPPIPQPRLRLATPTLPIPPRTRPPVDRDVPGAAAGTTRVAGRDRLDEFAANSPQLYGRYPAVSPWDERLAALGTRQGFDALPRRGTAADLDAAIERGWVETWRGVQAGEGITAAQINAKFRAGAYEPGRGMYGNGYYASVRRRTGEEYRGPEAPDGLLRIAIDPQAKFIDYDDLLKEQKAWLRTQRNRGKLTADELTRFTNDPEIEAIRLLKDPAYFATARGYDGIIVRRKDDGATYRVGERRADQYVILNRSAIMIQDAA